LSNATLYFIGDSIYSSFFYIYTTNPRTNRQTVCYRSSLKIKRRSSINLQEKIKLKKEISSGINVSENREKLLLSCEGLAKSIVTKFIRNNRHVPYEDLLQEAYIALDKSIMNWNENKSSLSTVATFYIKNRLIDVVRGDQYRINYFSSMSKKNISCIKKIQAVENFQYKSIDELSEITGIKKFKIKSVLNHCFSERRDIDGIHSFTSYSKPDSFPYCLEDLYEVAEKALDHKELEIFKFWVSHLKNPQKNSLVAQEFGIDKSEVRDIIGGAKKKIRAHVKTTRD
jgi:RNA polymerase sigma factor (sigma-70 family)